MIDCLPISLARNEQIVIFVSGVSYITKMQIARRDAINVFLQTEL